MRRIGIAAGAVLTLAMALWWALREPATAVEPRLATTSAQAPSIGVPLQSPASSARVAWTQSEGDLAWCRPTATDVAEGQTFTPEEAQRYWAELPFMKQGQEEVQRLKLRWTRRLRSEGGEQLLAAADIIESTDAAKRHLFDLARNTRNPVVYGWAMTICMQQVGCELSAQRWAQLDPGNLAPWAAEAQQAKERGVLQAQREAIYQIGLACRSEDYGRHLMSLEYGLAEASRAGLQMSTEVMQPFSEYASRRLAMARSGDCCSERGLKSEPFRRQSCLEAADAMWRTADDVMAATLALGWAQRLVPPDDPVWAKRRAEIASLQRRMTHMSEQMSRPFTERDDLCEALPATRQYLQAVADMGELAALRQLPDTSPP